MDCLRNRSAVQNLRSRENRKGISHSAHFGLKNVYFKPLESTIKVQINCAIKYDFFNKKHIKRCRRFWNAIVSKY